MPIVIRKKHCSHYIRALHKDGKRMLMMLEEISLLISVLVCFTGNRDTFAMHPQITYRQ